MKSLTPAEIRLLAGVTEEPTIEERALDAVILAHAQGTRYAFKDGDLIILPPIPEALRAIGAESRVALRLAVALVILAEKAGVLVATLAKTTTRYRFLQAYGDAAQSITDGGLQ